MKSKWAHYKRTQTAQNRNKNTKKNQRRTEVPTSLIKRSPSWDQKQPSRDGDTHDDLLLLLALANEIQTNWSGSNLQMYLQDTRTKTKPRKIRHKTQATTNYAATTKTAGEFEAGLGSRCWCCCCCCSLISNGFVFVFGNVFAALWNKL